MLETLSAMTWGERLWVASPVLFVALLAAAYLVGRTRRREPAFTEGPVRFVSHVWLMLALGAFVVLALAAVLVPLVARWAGP